MIVNFKNVSPAVLLLNTLGLNPFQLTQKITTMVHNKDF